MANFNSSIERSDAVRIIVDRNHEAQIKERGAIEFPKGLREQVREKFEDAVLRLDEARQGYLDVYLARIYSFGLYGSHYLPNTEESYKNVVEFTKEFLISLASTSGMKLVRPLGFNVTTGIGPGLMEAPHYGAFLANEEIKAKGWEFDVQTNGVGITSLPTLEKPNNYVQRASFRREFPQRAQSLVDPSHSSFFAPGGLGTLYEFTTILQQLQVGHLGPDYLVMVDIFWKPRVEDWKNAFFVERRKTGETALVSEGDVERIFDGIVFLDLPHDIPKGIKAGSDNFFKWYNSRGKYVQITS